MARSPQSHLRSSPAALCGKRLIAIAAATAPASHVLAPASLLLMFLFCSSPSIASAPVLLHTPGYQAPVHAAPDDLLFIAGDGFQATDRVVYETADPRRIGHPAAVPLKSNASLGVATVVQRGTEGSSLTVRLPESLRADRVYRLWIVTAAGEWSKSLLLNDPRPLWVTPSFAYATAQLANLDRRIRIVGRSLRLSASAAVSIRLRGPAVYELTSDPVAGDVPQLGQYVAEATLPGRMAAGSYAVSLRCGGCEWVEVPGQRFVVHPDPDEPRIFELTDPRFGSCHPDDGADDSSCFARAIEAARQSGGGTVVIPAGQWILATGSPDGFVLGSGVRLRGVAADSTSILWQARTGPRAPNPLLTLTGRNSIAGISFADEERFGSPEQSRPVIRLGAPPQPRSDPVSSGTIADVVLADNRFLKVGTAVVDSGRPLARLLILRNEFGAYQSALYLAHAARIVDSIVRWNRFLPGSYVDLSARQGTIASELGSSLRVDFSSNLVDGAATGALQAADDPPGFRAAFFWNLNDNQELLLVAQNRIQCPGDKAGDGEAIAFDGNGNTSGFEAAQNVVGAGWSWIKVHGSLATQRRGHPVTPDHYVGHWVLLMQGRGIGQTRKIVGYAQDPATSTVTLRVAPAWDVVPSTASRIVVERQYWQAYVIGNEVLQGSPPCRKSNLSDPKGGDIGIWAPSADSVIDANHQVDTDGIGFLQSYSARARSCSSCDSSASFQTGLEIRDNRIEGEYDWSSDCSKSGIMGNFSASPTPESSPPILGFGVLIDHNDVSHADGFRGGAIDITLTWYAGPPPADWPMVDNLLIFHNHIHDLEGSPPRAACHYGQQARTAIRMDGKDNVRNTVLYANKCERVSRFLEDGGKQTLRLCSGSSRESSCECAAEH